MQWRRQPTARRSCLCGRQSGKLAVYEADFTDHMQFSVAFDFRVSTCLEPETGTRKSVNSCRILSFWRRIKWMTRTIHLPKFDDDMSSGLGLCFRVPTHTHTHTYRADKHPTSATTSAWQRMDIAVCMLAVHVLHWPKSRNKISWQWEAPRTVRRLHLVTGRSPSLVHAPGTLRYITLRLKWIMQGTWVTLQFRLQGTTYLMPSEICLCHSWHSRKNC